MSCEIPEFYDEQILRARKAHKCVECHQPINPGEQYVACCGKWAGDVQVYKQHMRCYHFARHCNHEVWKEGYAECVEFGGIGEAVEHADFELKDQWRRIVAGEDFFPPTTSEAYRMWLSDEQDRAQRKAYVKAYRDAAKGLITLGAGI